MAWSDLTFTGCSVLTAGQMTAMQANFGALGQGAPGAPPLAPTSLMWTGQASGGGLTVSSLAALAGLTVSQVASIGTLAVAGGLVLPALSVTGASSLAGVEVSSRWVARSVVVTEQASAATLHVSSAATVRHLALLADPAATPDANTLYRGLIPKAWLHYQQTGTPAILEDENIDSVTDFAAGQFIPILDRDMSSADAWAAAGMSRSQHFIDMPADPGASGATFATRPRADGTSPSDQDDIFLIFFGRQT